MFGSTFNAASPSDTAPGLAGGWPLAPALVGTPPGRGLVAGTPVATAMGWRPAEALAAGDLVLTFDRGLRPVTRVLRHLVWLAPRAVPRLEWPVAVPAGAAGNGGAMLLLPDQPVMLESDVAETLFGDPFTLIAASDLVEFRGIRRVAPRHPAEVIELRFEQEEVVFAETGALVLCGTGETDDLAAPDERPEGAYRCLDRRTARNLLMCIAFEEDAADGQAPRRGPPGHAALA